MDELVNQVAEKTGLAPAQAKMAVDTVIDYLKDKLPAPVAGQIDAVLEGGGDLTGGLGGALGGMFGKK